MIQHCFNVRGCGGSTQSSLLAVLNIRYVAGQSVLLPLSTLNTIETGWVQESEKWS